MDWKAAQQRQAQLAEEGSKLRLQPKEAAKAVKDVESALPSLFTLELKWQTGPAFVYGSPDGVDVRLPFYFRETPGKDVFSSAAKVKFMLGNFGGQYKKSRVYKEEMFYQQPAYTAVI